MKTYIIEKNNYLRSIHVILSFIFLIFYSFEIQAQLEYIGSSSDEYVRSVKVLDNAIYFGLYSGANDQASIIKKDLSGNQIWQIDLDDYFLINDIAKQGSSVIGVGYYRPSANSSLFESRIVKITDNGSTAVLDFINEYPFSGRDVMTEVIAKPGSTTNFLVQQYRSDSGDTPAILELDNSGNILNRIDVTSSSDDQFWNGLKNGQSTLTMVGNIGGLSSGCYVELNNNLDVNRSIVVNGIGTFSDYIDRSDNRKILVGWSNPFAPVILEADSLGDVTWAKVMDQGRRFTQIFFGSSINTINGVEETYYITGDEEYSAGNFRQFVMKFVYTIVTGGPNTFSIDWTRYFDDGTTSTLDSRREFIANKFYSVEVKDNTSPSGFGGTDLLFSKVDKNLSSCITSDLMYTMSDGVYTSTSFVADTSHSSVPVAVVKTAGPALTFMTLDTCMVGPCALDSLFIGTGYDHINDTTHPDMAQDGLWLLEGAPTNNGPVSLGFPVFSIVKHPAWSPPGYNSTYVSAFNAPGSNAKNLNSALPPYLMRRCFCVTEDNTELEFNIDVHVDNRMQLYFYDPANPGSRFLLDQVPGSSTDNFKGPPEHLSIAPYTVPLAGTYCIEAEVRNDNEGSPMGLNINGWIKGASVIRDTCCSQTGYIVGFKYEDADCDGAVNMHDPAIENYEIELYDENDILISSIMTDANGYFGFAVDPGTYQVREVLQSDWEYSVPATGEFLNVVVDTNAVVQLQFGNIYTGPLVTNPLETSCMNPNDNINFTWTGQQCDCELELQVRACGSSDVWETVADFGNSGSYTYQIPDYYSGDYEFQINDCDDYEVPFVGCVNVGDYEVSIIPTQTGCGAYFFTTSITGVDPADIISHDWDIDILGTGQNPFKAFTFQDAGQYEITYTLVTDTGCTLTETIDLDVAFGANDPNCKFAPTNVLGEIEGDLFISDECQGVILKSPSGACFRITVGDDGSITSQAIDCP